MRLLSSRPNDLGGLTRQNCYREQAVTSIDFDGSDIRSNRCRSQFRKCEFLAITTFKNYTRNISDIIYVQHGSLSRTRLSTAASYRCRSDYIFIPEGCAPFRSTWIYSQNEIVSRPSLQQISNGIQRF